MNTGEIPGNSMIQAILFASNGVLVDTHDLHFSALNQALAPHGMTITEEEDLKFYRGLPTLQKLRLLTENKGLDPSLYEAIREAKRPLTIAEIDRQVELDLQKIDLFCAIKDAGLKVAVCSNSLQSTLVATLEAMGLYSHVDLVIGNDLGLAQKPSPDMYIHAARMLGVPIERCAIVEKSPMGIQAAKASGCTTIVRVKSCDEVVLSLLHFMLPLSSPRQYV